MPAAGGQPVSQPGSQPHLVGLASTRADSWAPPYSAAGLGEGDRGLQNPPTGREPVKPSSRNAVHESNPLVGQPSTVVALATA